MKKTSGFFNYMSSSSQSSLYKNGKVLTRRDISGSDAESVGIELKKYKMDVVNARNSINNKSISLEKQGFELFPSKLKNIDIDFFNNQQIINMYYAECADFIKEVTGACSVHAFDHNIRSAIGKKSKKMINGGQQVQGPAHIVHGDYTLTSAPARLQQLSNPPGKNDTLRETLGASKSLLSKNVINNILSNGRYAIINLWRNIVTDPVENNPLALCDASTVSSKDLIVFEIHYADRVGENYFAKHSLKHDWYFYDRMTKNEVLLIKQWDSEGVLATTKGKSSDSDFLKKPCTFSFHSAFEDPNTAEDAPDRWSMEVRCIVIY
ncbi:MAG: hypothetical protein HOF44_02550 [Pelagibacterales bacterium]|nr:hypothetical protein [Pelagibacterales bacterium]